MRAIPLDKEQRMGLNSCNEHGERGLCDRSRIPIGTGLTKTGSRLPCLAQHVAVMSCLLHALPGDAQKAHSRRCTGFRSHLQQAVDERGPPLFQHCVTRVDLQTQSHASKAADRISRPSKGSNTAKLGGVIDVSGRPKQSLPLKVRRAGRSGRTCMYQLNRFTASDHAHAC